MLCVTHLSLLSSIHLSMSIFVAMNIVHLYILAHIAKPMNCHLIAQNHNSDIKYLI